MRYIDITGQKFGMLTVLDSRGRQYVTCRCDCGKVKEMNRYNVMRGHTTSCGCMRGKSGGGGRKPFQECDEDCFNCKYPDCIMPTTYSGKKGVIKVGNC